MKSNKDESMKRSGLALTKNYDNFKRIYDPELFQQIWDESQRQ